MSPFPPALHARFELLDELGRGAVGAVYRARERSSGREVALKLLHGKLEPRTLARLRREGELTAQLAHSNIVGIHDAGDADGFPYLAYELISGAQPLDAYWEPHGTETRVRLVHDAASALGYAHAQGVLHRDVKFENLLVDANGRLRVADFGLATAQDLERLTRTGGLVGTPYTMSPEQLTSGTLSAASDVWSLGVILYVGLTDQLPFQATSMLDLLQAVSKADPPPPRSLAPACPGALQAICLKALSKSPQDRYPDGAAFAADLARFLSGEAVDAKRVSLKTAARAVRGLWWVLPLAVSVLAVVAALSLPTATPAVPAPVKPEAVSEVVSDAPVREAPFDLETQAKRGELDAQLALAALATYGSRLEHVPPTPRTVTRWLTRAAATGDPRGLVALARHSLAEGNQDVAWDLASSASKITSPSAHAARCLLLRVADRRDDLKLLFEQLRAAHEADQWVEPVWLEIARRRWPTLEGLRGLGFETSRTRDPVMGFLALHEGDLLLADAGVDERALLRAQGVFQRGLKVGHLTCTQRVLEISALGVGGRGSDALAQLGAEAARRAQAKFVLGVNLLDGAMEQNDAKGVEYLRQAAERWPPAAYRLAILLRDGDHGVAADAEQAASLFRSASEAGHVDALRGLAHLLLARRVRQAYPGEMEVALYRLRAAGDENARDFTTTRRALAKDETVAAYLEEVQRDAARGDPSAMRQLAKLYREGLGCDRDLLVALDWLHRAVGLGDMAAMGNMAQFLNSELKDRAGCRYWLARAARSKSRAVAGKAAASLAGYLIAEEGPTQRVRELIQKAADSGSREGFRLLAQVCELDGNLAGAAENSKRAVEAGDMHAQLQYARLLWRGAGLTADPAEAERILRAGMTGSNQSHASSCALALAQQLKERARYREAREIVTRHAFVPENEAGRRVVLGWLVLNGQGGPKSPEAARGQFREAAHLGDPHAWHALGVIYRDGLGTDVDDQRAAVCLARAAKAEGATGEMHRDHAAFLASGRAGPERVAEGRRRLRELRATD